MPWQPKDLMETKMEFVELALKDGVNRRELCRRFGISPKTGYELIKRYVSDGSAGLVPRSRRPLSAPARSSAEVEAAPPASQLGWPQDQRLAWRRRARAARAHAQHRDPHPSSLRAHIAREQRRGHGLASLRT